MVDQLDRRYKDAMTITSLSMDELEMLMSFISLRDMEPKTRQALRDRLGNNIGLVEAAARNNVNYRNVSRAENKIITMHQRIKEMYK